MNAQERARIGRMRGRKLKALGRPIRVLPHEHERAQKILRRATEAGMTYAQMAEQIDVNRTTLGPIADGRVKSPTREVYNKILGLRIEADIPEGRTRHHGARQDPTATMRKFQALHALGFPVQALAPMLDWDPPYARYFLRAKPKYVYAAIAQGVSDLYAKLQNANPADFGVTPGYAAAARARALSYGFAPPAAWDEDTIGDPSAFAQWTGACGTPEGRAIHKREGIPMCPACRSPKDDSYSYGKFSPDFLLAHQRRMRLSRREFAEAAHLSPGTIEAYTLGTRVPPTATIERLADVLRCRPEELCE